MEKGFQKETIFVFRRASLKVNGSISVFTIMKKYLISMDHLEGRGQKLLSTRKNVWTTFLLRVI